ncbi:pentatricopeptide repeat-containing protein, putative [Ectocarpus siliculosus]|uniref:Pentatricopeptide repeat-containing protein, putative n=1 Tax=Ectocarpus siliculosus TaxID=2880 RepID=D7G7R2_ECTSI|nr:pentatricopeptide repeat-containing protein, putative [Ectocarpus siliculosus]|eukprot:CBJ27793.1 pentatricopeptide repeat-containing protein, putative [Ectocarpus siliculosus]
MMVRPRPTTLAPTTDAGEDRALSSSESTGEDGGASSNTATLDRVEAQAAAAGGGRGGRDEARQNGNRKRLGVIGRAGSEDRRFQRRTLRTPRPSTRVASFRELNSRKVDRSLVKQSVLHYLSDPEELTVMQFTNLGMASSRHCDIHLTVEVIEQHHIAAETMRTEGLQKSLFAYNALISGCASGRGYERALGYFDDMRKAGVEPDEMTFASIIATIRDGSEGSPERAIEAVQMMKEAGLRPDTYCMNSVMAVNVQARQPNAALKIFEEMKRDDIPRDVVSYNTAISACDKLQDAETAVRLLRQAREDDVEPDVFSYNTAISALGHSCQWQEAARIFEEMNEAGVAPSLMTYNTLISGCVRAQAPSEALSVFYLMKERGIKRDQYSFAGALHASVHLRDYELAMNLLEEMIDMGMPANSQSYATAIRTCARCSKSDEAVFLYASQLRMSIVPTEMTYKALVEAFTDCKDARRAAWVLDEMREMLVPIEHVHLMDVLYACTDQCDIALEVLRLNEELGLDAVPKMYAMALEVCITAGDYEASTIALDKMTAAGFEPRPDQEKRMLRSCADPQWISKRHSPGELQRVEEEGEGEGRDVPTDFWQDRDEEQGFHRREA